jgi:hypothetical protein
MAKCQVNGFDCPQGDLCTVCKGSGDDPQTELCTHCDHCFDELLGWSTGIEPGTASAESVRREILR